MSRKHGLFALLTPVVFFMAANSSAFAGERLLKDEVVIKGAAEGGQPDSLQGLFSPAKLASRLLPAKAPKADFSGYYYSLTFEGLKPKALILRKGNIRVTCTAPAWFTTNFVIEQAGSKAIIYSPNLGIFKGKAKGKKLTTKQKSGPSLRTLNATRPKPTITKFDFTIKQKLAAGIFCLYRYKSQAFLVQ